MSTEQAVLNCGDHCDAVDLMVALAAVAAIVALWFLYKCAPICWDIVSRTCFPKSRDDSMFRLVFNTKPDLDLETQILFAVRRAGKHLPLSRYKSCCVVEVAHVHLTPGFSENVRLTPVPAVTPAHSQTSIHPRLITLLARDDVRDDEYELSVQFVSPTKWIAGNNPTDGDDSNIFTIDTRGSAVCFSAHSENTAHVSLRPSAGDSDRSCTLTVLILRGATDPGGCAVVCQSSEGNLAVEFAPPNYL